MFEDESLAPLLSCVLRGLQFVPERFKNALQGFPFDLEKLKNVLEEFEFVPERVEDVLGRHQFVPEGFQIVLEGLENDLQALKFVLRATGSSAQRLGSDSGAIIPPLPLAAAHPREALPRTPGHSSKRPTGDSFPRP